MSRSHSSGAGSRLVVEEEMDGPDFVGVQAAGVLDGAGRRQVEAVHEHHDDVAAQDGRLGGFDPPLFELWASGGTGGSAV